MPQITSIHDRAQNSDVNQVTFFFETLSQGGSERPMPNGHGYMKWFSDGTHVSFRPTISRDGTPVIEITVASPGSKLAAYQKIHFVKGHKR